MDERNDMMEDERERASISKLQGELHEGVD